MQLIAMEKTMVKTFLLLVANTVVTLGEYSLSILNKYKIASYIYS